MVRQISDQNLHATANTPVKHSEVYPDVLNPVKENASNKIPDFLNWDNHRPCQCRTGFSKSRVCLQVLASLLSPLLLSPHFSHCQNIQTLFLQFFFTPKHHKNTCYCRLDYLKSFPLPAASCPVQFAGANKTDVDTLLLIVT